MLHVTLILLLELASKTRCVQLMMTEEAKEQDFTSTAQAFPVSHHPTGQSLGLWKYTSHCSYMAKDTGTERDEEFNAIYQMEQGNLKIGP